MSTPTLTFAAAPNGMIYPQDISPVQMTAPPVANGETQMSNAPGGASSGGTRPNMPYTGVASVNQNPSSKIDASCDQSLHPLTFDLAGEGQARYLAGLYAQRLPTNPDLRFAQANPDVVPSSALLSCSHPAGTNLDIQKPLPSGAFGNGLDFNDLGFNFDAIEPTAPDNWLELSLQGGWDYSNDGLAMAPFVSTSNEVPTPTYPNGNAASLSQPQTIPNTNASDANQLPNQMMQDWNGAPFPNILENGFFPTSQESVNPSSGASGPHPPFHPSFQNVPPTSGQQGPYYPPLDRILNEHFTTGFSARQSVPQTQSPHANVYDIYSQAIRTEMQSSYHHTALPFPNGYPLPHTPSFTGPTTPHPLAYPPPQLVQPGMPNYAFQPTGPYHLPHHLPPTPTLSGPPQTTVLEGSHNEPQSSASQNAKLTKSKGKGKARAKSQAKPSRSKRYTREAKMGKKKAAKPVDKGVRLPDELELAERINGKLYFALNVEQHPSLYLSLPTPASDYDTDTIKYVRVDHKPGFKRKPRYALPEPEVDEASTSNPTIADERYGIGRPKIGTSHRRQKAAFFCPCGRRYPVKRSLQVHMHYQTKAVKDPLLVSCDAFRLQRKSGKDRCMFCDETIGEKQKEVENHFWKCQPLAEIKTLVRERHLFDDGLLEREIKAFNWPVVPVRM